MENKQNHIIPPVIRVFLSSTFADMDNERSYFNEVLVPRLNRICAERGVSFFSVDLRWGITEDEQMNGQVLPICLGEIDRCRPYFIGILGNRYGSLLENVPLNVSDSIPWLEGKEGKSITELEMLYAVLDKERGDNVPYASFYFRDNSLTEKWYGHTEAEDGNLKKLKETIRTSTDVRHSSYKSIEEFGEKVMGDILAWCDIEFPAPERVQEVRRQWYNGELLRSYIPVEENHAFLDAYCTESRRSLMLHGEGERGKTTLLSAWTPADGKKILINCGSDDMFRHWPRVAIEVILRLINLEGAEIYLDESLKEAVFAGTLREGKQPDGSFYFTTPRTRENFRHAFLNWVTNLSTPYPVYVVINDLNLLDDDETRMLSWIPSASAGGVRFICSTNSEDMVEFADIIGWNCKEMPAFSKENASRYVQSYLSIYGKSLSASQHERMMASPVTLCPGYLRTVSDFLINHGRFHNLDSLISGIAAFDGQSDLYPFLYDYLTADAGETASKITAFVLGLLCHSPVSLTESECYSLAGSRYSFTAMEWSGVRNIMEQFRIIKGDYWNITVYDLKAAITSRLTADESASICETLGDHFSLLLKESANKEEVELKTVAYAKAILTLYAKAKSHEKLLSALADLNIFSLLYKLERPSIRAAWLHLFLNSDTDLDTFALNTLQSFIAHLGNEHPATVAMADIFLDMELFGTMDKAKALMGDTEFYGSVSDLCDDYSNEFRDILLQLFKKRRESDVRTFYGTVCEVYKYADRFSDSELCRILYLKADCETKLRANLELVKTANLYFKTAVKSGNQFELNLAMSILAQTCRDSGNNAEALRLRRKLCKIYLAEGKLRNYMAEGNYLGIALYNTQNYDEAIELLTNLYELWLKKNEKGEAGIIYLNLCNAYYCKGDTEAAFNMAANGYDAFKNYTDAQSRTLCASLLGNMGLYARELHRNEEAEGYLSETLKLAEEMGLESTFLNAARTLAKLYTATGSFMKSFAIHESIMEMHWKRREYDMVMGSLDKACVQLRLCNHYRQVNGFVDKWRKRFATVEGGERYFNEKVTDTVLDSRTVERRREALAMAKSEGDPLRIAKALCDLANALRENDFEGYWSNMAAAADIYRMNGFEKELQLHAIDMLAGIMKEGVPKSPDHLSQVLSYTKAEPVHELARLWTDLGKHGNKDDKEALESVEELLEKTLSYTESYQNALFRCWYDVAEVIVSKASPELLLRMTGSISDIGTRNLLENRFEKKYIKDIEEKIEILKRDYISSVATDILSYYENAVAFMEAIKANNAAALAGNIALIFRRRRDEEKTLYYHKLSMESYRRQNSLYDCLIEQMNLATAYKEFGRKQEAIQCLRDGMKEAKANSVYSLEASIAGNLAALLRDFGTADDHSEIIQCFETEESFFRKEGLTRDLTISLINQSVYHLKRNDRDTCIPKLEEAGKLIRKHRFAEFYQTLAYIENQVGINKTVKSSDESPEDFIKDMLSFDKDHSVTRVFSGNGGFCADVVPQKEDELYLYMYRLIFDPNKDNEITFYGVFMPKRYSEESTNNVKAYIDWSNERLTYYKMILSDNLQVQGGYRVVAANRDELKKQLEFYMHLWRCDCMNLSMLFTGFTELELCQGMKLRFIHEISESDE